VLEHGYCRSVYVKDPNGMILEFTLDHPEADKISRERRTRAHQELQRWLAGNHQSNNTYR
jgi:catechol-2,3-dioxygenase